MTDVKLLIQEATDKQKTLVGQVRELDMKRQMLLQESLKLEGEIRLLQRISNNGEAPTS